MRLSRSLFALLVFFWAFLGGGHAVSGDFSSLAVYPIRIVIDPHQRSASIDLRNNSKEQISYRMRMLEMGLDDTGDLVFLKPPLPEGHRSAAPVVRYSPRQIRLQSGETQNIRFMVKRRRQLSEGEYRSHIEIRALPKVDDQSLESASKAGDNQISVEVNTQVAITLPVIVRHGKVHAELSLKSVSISGEEARQVAVVHITRTGNRSVYGDIELFWQPNGSDTRKPIGVMYGWGLYAPYKDHHVQIPLSSSISTQELKKGQVIVTLTDTESDHSRGHIWMDEGVVAVVAN